MKIELHPRDWPEIHGMVALVLALGAVAAVVLLSVETILHPGAITESEATVLSTAVGAIIGAVATYLGVSKARADDEPTPPAVPTNVPGRAQNVPTTIETTPPET